MINYLYRHVYLNRTTKDSLHRLIKDLLTCNGNIISIGYLSNGFSEDKFSYWETFYTIRFLFIEDLQAFVNKGWSVRESELVSNNMFTNGEDS